MSDTLQIVCPHCDCVNHLPAARLAQQPYCGRCADDLFSGRPLDLNAHNFDVHISASDIPVVVNFWAPWSEPCRRMAPAFERATVALEPEVRLARLNVEDAPKIAQRLDIGPVPALLVFRHGEQIGRRNGSMLVLQLLGWIGDQCRPEYSAATAMSLQP